MSLRVKWEWNEDEFEGGRGSRVRTRDLRFWRPSLYQLSYTPIEAVDTMPCTGIQVQNAQKFDYAIASNNRCPIC